MATFDFPNKVIILDDPAVSPTQNAVDIYSEWKVAVKVADNTKYLRAFDDSVGGNDTNPPEKISGYVFVRNDLGWRIRPFEADGETILSGDLFPFDTGQPLYLTTIGNFSSVIRLQVSSKALAVETGVSGLTPTESTQLGDIDVTTKSMDTTLTSIDGKVTSMDSTLTAMDITLTALVAVANSIDGTVTTLRKLMMNRMETDPVTGVMTIYDDDDSTPLLTANIYEDVLAAQIYQGRGLERRNRLT